MEYEYLPYSEDATTIWHFWAILYIHVHRNATAKIKKKMTRITLTNDKHYNNNNILLTIKNNNKKYNSNKNDNH